MYILLPSLKAPSEFGVKESGGTEEEKEKERGAHNDAKRRRPAHMSTVIVYDH